MKRFIAFLLTILLLTGCAAAKEAPVETTVAPTVAVTVPETQETVPAETEPPVIAGSQIADGSYEIEVESDASMFKIVHCVLTVENGTMTAAMTMSGQGYGYVYLGTKEEAAQDTEENYIPFETDENGGKVFTVPVEALNQEVKCAAWSIKKETWYDRTLIFKADGIPAEALNLE